MDLRAFEDIYPLSPAQRTILEEAGRTQNIHAGACHLRCEIRGELDAPEFENAWQQVVDRHQILRTSFVWKRIERPLQMVQRELKVSVVERDWRALSTADQERKIAALMTNESRQKIGPARAPLFHLTLCRLEDEAYAFIWTYHSLILDRRSAISVIKEVIDRYESSVNGSLVNLAPIRPYWDYVDWATQRGASLPEQTGQEQSQDVASHISIPGTRVQVRSSSDFLRDGARSLRLPVATAAVRSTTAEYGLTVETLLTGIWTILLSRYTDEPEILLGIESSDLPDQFKGAEVVIGPTTVLAPLRARLAGDMPALAWMKLLQERQMELRGDGGTAPRRPQLSNGSSAKEPKFLSIVRLNSVSENDLAPKSAAGLWLSGFEIIEPGAAPLAFTITEAPLTLHISYDRKLYDEETVARWLGHVEAALEGIIENPERPLSRLSLLSRSESRRLLVEWNDTQANYPGHRCIHHLFEDQAERVPDNLALKRNGKTLTYRELNERANKLARFLRVSGVGPETVVGLCVERSVEMVVGMLGILKAGGAYLALDPTYPPERSAFILDDARVPILLTQERLIDNLVLC
ncbi:MAG: condensation domain-containing protein [Acidobacteria bacterium]|nr:condensation domain-containing protein [Acidobacteriota bacterium]